MWFQAASVDRTRKRLNFAVFTGSVCFCLGADASAVACSGLPGKLTKTKAQYWYGKDTIG